MSGTVIVKCHCGMAPLAGGTQATTATLFQDRLYGKGRRVANYTAKGEAGCTCCGTVHRSGFAEMSRPAKKGGGGGGRGRARVYIAQPPKDGWVGGEPGKNGWSPKGGR